MEYLLKWIFPVSKEEGSGKEEDQAIRAETQGQWSLSLVGTLENKGVVENLLGSEEHHPLWLGREGSDCYLD